MKVFNDLREKLKEIIEIDELAYLTVKDEAEAFAFYKADTELFSLEDWQKFHKVEYPTIIKNIPVLVDLVSNKRYVAVEDVFKLNPPQKEFQVLNIHSIYLLPVIDDDKVVGFVDIAYIGKHYKIDKETLDKIQEIINGCKDEIIKTVKMYNN
ncbi:hypothetical protein [Clostridium isatidis]|uniref:GAF domain-containing protein n=1 Tax=Clostridium isatidis TaxID=182773 RepID=A0A343JFR3_9CLOT|nr:hypothetical protein [Clostridium isatidis]ASW44371.1 hypothetical protein BEN51_13305 [Clostridium isatidis]